VSSADISVPADLPPLTSRAVIDAAAVAAFERDGHVRVDALASSAEVAAYRPAIEATTERVRWDRRPLEERDTYGRAFVQSANLWKHDPVVARFTLAPRFAAAAATLLGVDAVRLYHDQALFKEPGGGATPWHQDQYYWPLTTDDTVTMWMPLVDVRAPVEGMTFAVGSHRLGDLGGGAISDESERRFAGEVRARALTCFTHRDLAAGDVTFHRGWTLHRASDNPTGRMRPVMTVIYVADGARVAPPRNAAQEFDRRLWLGGAEPGSLVDGPDNPRIPAVPQDS
jgi:ectoine hydroxylase-related dioxygenase (phytanoyl-CoA dioxygenase family)